MNIEKDKQLLVLYLKIESSEAIRALTAQGLS